MSARLFLFWLLALSVLVLSGIQVAFSTHGVRELHISLQAGELIELEVAGFRSVWEKLPTHGTGDQRHGIKASGEAHRLWHEMRDERRGGIASIRICI